jgi:pimeloyl-ACP methyl ester carboxylesterase
MPKAPFNYESREVSIPNREAEGVVLSGTLTIPTEDAPFPAVVLVTGSGPQDRDESLMDHKPFLVIADYLSRHGIAVLRYDDRGIGKSTGNFAASTTEDFASDAKAVVEFLSQQKQIDTDRIGLIGHSEGGLIAAMLAASDERLAHAVMLAGPGLPGAEIIISQAQAIVAKSGQVDPHEDIRKQVIELIVNDASKEEIDKVIEAFVNLNNSQAASDESEDAADESSDDQSMGLLKKAFQQMDSPWFRYFVKYDPRTDLRRVRCPILALIGANDLQVLADLNIPAIETALTESGIEGHRCERLEGLNHLFQESESGLPTEYGTITQTVSPVVLESITKWVKAH